MNELVEELGEGIKWGVEGSEEIIEELRGINGMMREDEGGCK
jgi:hypothetical protein